jgi:hypothetical protein
MPKYITIRNKYTVEYNLEDDLSAKLPIIEFAYGSLQLSRKQALIEMGFPEEEVDNLMEMRLAEDLVLDPAVKTEMGLEAIKKITEKNG